MERVGQLCQEGEDMTNNTYFATYMFQYILILRTQYAANLICSSLSARQMRLNARQFPYIQSLKFVH